MSNETDDRISALVDDELDESELGHVLTRLRTDTACRARWQRYQLTNAVLRDSLPEVVDLDLARRIRRCVASEQIWLESTPGWRKPVLGLAIAASVTLGVGLGAALLITRDSAENPQLAKAAAPAPAQTDTTVFAGDGAQVVVDRWDQVAAKRVYPYLINHNEMAVGGVIPTVVPYGRLIGHDQGR